jgi:hypothetical protein
MMAVMMDDTEAYHDQDAGLYMITRVYIFVTKLAVELGRAFD